MQTDKSEVTSYMMPIICHIWDLRFSWQWKHELWSFGLWRCVVLWLPVFRRYMSAPSSGKKTMELEATRTSKTVVTTYKTTWCHKAEDHNPQLLYTHKLHMTGVLTVHNTTRSLLGVGWAWTAMLHYILSENMCPRLHTLFICTMQSSPFPTPTSSRFLMVCVQYI
jgi:hypothetical protein